MGVIKSIKNFFSFKTLGIITGSKIIVSIFYIGYLPEWSRHWAAFFSVIFSIVLVYNTCGFDASPLAISYVLMLEFFYGFILANIIIPIFRKAYPFVKLETIVIDAFLAQVLLLGACIPPILYINKSISGFAEHMCSVFLNCNSFALSVLTIFTTILGPYFILRFFDIVEFWPTNRLFLYSESSFLRIIAGLIPALYTTLVLYLASFIFFDLTLVDVGAFYKIIFTKLYIHFTIVFLAIIKFLNTKNLYSISKKLGIIYLLDKYGFINMQHYDTTYL